MPHQKQFGAAAVNGTTLLRYTLTACAVGVLSGVAAGCFALLY